MAELQTLLQVLDKTNYCRHSIFTVNMAVLQTLYPWRDRYPSLVSLPTCRHMNLAISGFSSAINNLSRKPTSQFCLSRLPQSMKGHNLMMIESNPTVKMKITLGSKWQSTLSLNISVKSPKTSRKAASRVALARRIKLKTNSKLAVLHKTSSASMQKRRRLRTMKTLFVKWSV